MLNPFFKKTLFIAGLFCVSHVAFASEASDLRSSLSPVRSQGDVRNVCSSFEATALAEFLMAKQTGKMVEFSENYNYWAAKNYTLTNPALQAYGHVDGLAGYLAVQGLEHGVMLETSWPYDDQNGISQKDPACAANDQTPLECFTGTPPQGAPVIAMKINPIFVPREQIADYLAANQRPVLMNIRWYYDAVDKQGNVRMPTMREISQCENKNDASVCGGHVVMLVGYEPAQDRYIFRNSWGADWGVDGYGTIPKDFIEQDCESCHSLDKTGLSADEKNLVDNSSMGATAELLPN